MKTMMMMNTWTLLLAVTTLPSVAGVKHCRCESDDENLYSRRQLALEIHGNFHSVKIDGQGYYIVDGVRILPPTECEQHEGKLEKNDGHSNIFNFGSSFFGSRRLDNIFSRGGSIRGAETNAESSVFFSCDAGVVESPPSGTGMPEDVEKFLLLELAKPKFVMDKTGNLMKDTPEEPFLHETNDGTPYLVESEIECSKLPMSVRLNPRAIPFHCRCPKNVKPTYLHTECHGSTH
jgi:hypothetical protein